jgi:thioredoxin reductase
MEFRPDPASIAGKPLAVAERTQLLIVGAGPAGLAAAMEGARQGLSVVVVDENPVASATMGDDVPLHFGQRMSGAVRNQNAMLEAFAASDPAIARAFDAGVGLRLGIACWGIYSNGPAVAWLPGPVAGLTDGSRSWMIAADRMVVASGRRDMGLAFPGWEKPGVMGISAALRLATRYGALDARRAVVLGSTIETLHAAVALREAGVEILAIIEQAPTPVAPQHFADQLVAGGTMLLCSHVVRSVEGTDGVTAVRVARCDAPHIQTRIACDTALLGIGAVPVIDLLDAAGCRIDYCPERGGHVPVLDDAQRTTVAGILAAGDCAGIWPAKTLSPEIAREEGRRAVSGQAARVQPDQPHHDIGAYRLAWTRASVLEADGEPFVCQCEEITARDILEVRPPRYLNWPRERRNARDLRDLLAAPVPNPDHVKRLTRAGMGLCQGRRCREQVAALLALESSVPLHEIPLATHRAPVRPLPLSAVAETKEPAEMTRHWDTWFGMPSQYRPFWEIK